MNNIESKSPRIPRWLMWILKMVVGGTLVAFVLSSGRLDIKAVGNAVSTGHWWFLLGVGMLALVPIVGGLRWWLLLRVAGTGVSLLEGVRLSSITCFFNTFLPGATGGDVIRIYGAAKAFPARRTEAVLTIFADRLAGLFSLILLALVVLALNYSALVEQPVVRRAAIILGVVMLFVAVVVVFVLSDRMRKWRHRLLQGRLGSIRRTLLRIEQALDVFRGSRSTLLICVAISFVAHLCSALTLYAAARTIEEVGIPFARYFFLAPLSFAVNSIPISPGGAGQGEGFADVLFRTMGSDNGAEIFLLFRMMMILAWAPGGLLYLTGSVSFRTAEAAEEQLEQEAQAIGDV